MNKIVLDGNKNNDLEKRPNATKHVTDGDCVIFRSYVLQSGKVIEKIYECAITKLDAEIALEIFKENAGDL